MKKVFLGLSAFGILGFFSGAFADNGDIISAFTNNRFNEKSANVKELNDEQMSQVIGGMIYYWPGYDKRFSNYGFTERYIAYAYVDLANDMGMDNTKYISNTFNGGIYSGQNKQGLRASLSEIMGVSWGEVNTLRIRATYTPKNAWQYRYNYVLEYQMNGESKWYELYTKQANNLLKFYEFDAKRILDSRKY